MCGIAGILRFDQTPPDPDRLGAMREHLRHRGPEGHGQSSLGPCALTATRLSIIDVLSGEQPMRVPEAAHGTDDGRCASTGPLHLVFNGEIYNHRELRRKLQQRGHRFRSDHSDTEVLLYGYRQWGTNLPRHIHGMFAFAIWDQQHQRLFLCRDRSGIKPLFFHRSDRGLVFASLVSAVMLGLPAPQRPGPDRAALLTYLRYGYTIGRSLNQGVEPVPPAHWMTIAADGTTETGRYWRPPPISKSSTSLGAVQSLREVLTEAVHARIEADVPLGCFLSGGLNSSVVAALAQQKMAAEGHGPLRTFAVSVPELAYDETRHAQMVARHIGSEHQSISVSPGSAIDDLRTLIAIFGEPTAEPTLLPTYWLCRAARQHVRAALTGIGGDELFGGHRRYQRLRRYQRHGWWLRLNPAGPDLSCDPARQYHTLIRLFDEHTIAALGLDHAPQGSTHPADDWPDGPDCVHNAMRWDLEHNLPDEVLRRVDHASMASAMELRCPLLASSVKDLAGHLPTRVLMPGGRSSGLLRAVAAQMLPVSIATRPRQPFPLPLGAWFRGILHDTLRDHLDSDALDRLGLRRTEALRLFEQHAAGKAEHTRPLLALLMLVLWEAWRREPDTPPTWS